MVSSISLSSVFQLWTPTYFAESSDGQPLALTIPELFWDFDYSRLPPQSLLVGYFLRPEVMVLWILLYLSSKDPLMDAIDYFNFQGGKSRALRGFVALHNLALCIFSSIMAYHSWYAVILHLQEYGWDATYCDSLGTLWSGGLGVWSTIFYLSKYWEFVDTWILILKGKDPSFLQVYHHAGVIFIMWGGVVTQAPWMLYAVLFNSVVHAIMYSYFCIKTIWPSMQIPAAKYLTRLQITQFLVGIVISAGILLRGDECDSQASRFMLAIMHVYGYGLVALFVAFARKKYDGGKKRKSEMSKERASSDAKPTTDSTTKESPAQQTDAADDQKQASVNSKLKKDE